MLPTTNYEEWIKRIDKSFPSIPSFAPVVSLQSDNTLQTIKKIHDSSNDVTIPKKSKKRIEKGDTVLSAKKISQCPSKSTLMIPLSTMMRLIRHKLKEILDKNGQDPEQTIRLLGNGPQNIQFALECYIHKIIQVADRLCNDKKKKMISNEEIKTAIEVIG